MTKEHGTIRLVVCDLDGTLLDPERQISQEAVDAIGGLKERGIGFAFITGRPPYAVKRFALRAGVEGPLAGCNGALIFEGERILARHSFSLEPLRTLIEAAAARGMTVLLYQDGTEYCLMETEWTRSRALPVRQPEWGKPAEKVNIFSEEKAASFEALVPQIKALAEAFSVAIYGSSGCEIVAGGVNKATALAELCALYGVPKEEVLAIGDNANDNPMLLAAGIGAAVANAAENTKGAADYICRRSYAGGVVEAIGRFCLTGEAGEAPGRSLGAIDETRHIHQYSV
jgi:Cof subfamily protein (haloacid dehalogenase superfamily)